MRAPWEYFVDPVLRAPTIGCMLMCLAASLVGVVVFLRRQSLLGESLSHACYPGVIMGVVMTAAVGPQANQELWLTVGVLGGAFVSALVGLWCIEQLRQRFSISYDAALCLILSLFFGVGVTLASRVQFSHTILYRQIQVYLYGQAATMRDFHILIYLVMAVLSILVVAGLYKEIQALVFDREFAKSVGIPVHKVDFALFALIVLAVVIGIRSVGVVLMSAMLIAPPVAARQFTQTMWKMYILAGVIGVVSGFLGNYLSSEVSHWVNGTLGATGFILPTGPMIVLVAATLTLLSLLLAPQQGLLLRLLRMIRFRHRCLRENILKSCWRMGPKASFGIRDVERLHLAPRLYLWWLFRRFLSKQWVQERETGVYQLTDKGSRQGARIVRLHRLWELYLVQCVGLGEERVHHSAEEMEHVLTPKLEEELTALLENPAFDPHQKPIPRREETI